MARRDDDGGSAVIVGSSGGVVEGVGRQVVVVGVFPW